MGVGIVGVERDESCLPHSIVTRCSTHSLSYQSYTEYCHSSSSQRKVDDFRRSVEEMVGAAERRLAEASRRRPAKEALVGLMRMMQE